MKVVFIAGKLRAPSAWELAENIREAQRWALKVADCGAMPLCPHANTGLFHGLQDERHWFVGTLELLKRSDAALFIPNWIESDGAQKEHEFAQLNRIEIFGPGHVPTKLRHWILTGER